MIEERLKHTLNLVIDFVKFAEAKNAALLAANGVLVVGVLQAWSSQTHLATWQCYYAIHLLLFLSLSVLVTLVSFIPLKEFPKLLPADRPVPQDNLVFFGDIAKYDATQYLKALETQSPAHTPVLRYHKDLAGQVIINSRVALRKYRCFTWALWLTIVGLSSPIMGLCVWLFLNHIKKRRPNG